ncbi:FAD-dependent oxidoreductase [Spirochaeta cellobiosiphila]|uniref:FAD-dependent oxidoreductase n=1 Tax=Spirochaeta cellobiosiphila TaxID=504483 RepID=UPI0004237EAB|nr:FAD-dependent oxidoreductase [Spirochaeta cellobiosiphila]
MHLEKRKRWEFLILSIALVSIFSISGCSMKNGDFSFKPGTYTGEGEGHNGPIKVEVTVDDKKITDVKILEHSETDGIADAALSRIPKAVVDTQSIAVDTVSGATMVSNGILDAIKAALLNAGAKDEQLGRDVVKKNEGEIKELQTDIVVIGAGGSGTAAAVTAAEHGAKVIVLEKTAIPGGTTANGGGFFAADSEKARELGQKPLNIDLIFDKYMEEMDWKADANLVKQFLELSTTTADWLQAHGVVFHKMEEAVQQSHTEGTNGYHKYDDFTKTKDQLGAMLDTIKSNNAALILYETPAKELMVEDGIVKGVIAKAHDGTTYKINAKSVIIASGGFVGNSEMVSKALGGPHVKSIGYDTNVGDGINMAVDLGAATRGMEAMVLHTFSVDGANKVTGDFDHPLAKTYATSAIAYTPIIPWLNPGGFRYANEDIVYDRALSTNALVSQGDYAWFLYNESLLNTLEQKGASAAGMNEPIAMGPIHELTPIHSGWPNLTEIVDQMVEAGDVKKADTLDELAKETGMDPVALKETMAKYNSDAKNKKDSQYGKLGQHMYDLSSGPYYAFKIRPNNLCTVGGVRINANLQVVLNDPDQGYTPIKNLYAAGADAGAIYSDHYAHTIEGAAQGWAYNSGRLAGARATENALGGKIDLLAESK